MDKKPAVKNIYSQLPELFASSTRCVIATVTETFGSTPQVPGSTAIFTNTGLIDGTVGGGAVELSVSENAASAVKNGKSAYLNFNLENDISDEDAAICGGGMSILLDASPEKHRETFRQMADSVQKREAGVLLTRVEHSADGNAAIQRNWLTTKNFENESRLLPVNITNNIAGMLKNPVHGNYSAIPMKSSTRELEQYAFLESIVPLPQLIIAGAGHVGKALSHIGKLLDFEVIVWDERDDYANKNNLPDADGILTGPIEESLAKIDPDKNTYIVIVTPGHKNDTQVLRTFIGSSAGYIGMIGSRGKIGQVREKFLTSGWATQEQWDRVHTPIGLNINSKTVQEIAVSIAAQLVQVRYQINHLHG